MTSIIEPCCAERQLSQLLRESRDRAVIFQTHGDVTVKNFAKSTMLLCGDRPRTLTLAIDALSPDTEAELCKMLRLGWVSQLHLMTTAPLTADEWQHILAAANLTDAEARERIHLAADPYLVYNFLRWDGPDATVALQGTLPADPRAALHLYAAIMGKATSQNVSCFTSATNAHFRARTYAAPTATAESAAEAVVSGSPADTTQGDASQGQSAPAGEAAPPAESEAPAAKPVRKSRTRKKAEEA